jgi:hypothetical protein
MNDYADMDMDDLIAARAELLDELAEVETAIAELVADEAECSTQDED